MQNAGPGATSLTFGGLIPGTAYTFMVWAENAAGTGATSTPNAPITAAQPPGPPVLGLIEPPRRLPNSITEAVREKNKGGASVHPAGATASPETQG